MCVCVCVCVCLCVPVCVCVCVSMCVGAGEGAGAKAHRIEGGVCALGRGMRGGGGVVRGLEVRRGSTFQR